MRTRGARLALVLGLILSGDARAQSLFEAELTGAAEIPGPGLRQGSALATLTVESRTLTLTITPYGFADRMAVHIHKGDAGATGRLLVEFPWVSAANGFPVTVTAQTPAPFPAKVAANPEHCYAEIHTSRYPAGAARGQLHARPATAGPGHLPAATFPRPGPQPRSPSAMTYEFVFRHFTPDDERAAGLLETEVPILRQVADDCERALDELSLQQADERPGVIDAHVAQLRSRLGMAAFASLDSYIARTFEPDDEGSGSSTPSPRAARIDQHLTFPPPPPKVHRDPDFTLKASSTSGLRAYFTASGDCTVRGATVRLLSAGNCWLTAHQPGNVRYNPAQEVEQRLRIEKDDQRISSSTVPPMTYRDPDFPLNATASSGLPVVVMTNGKCTMHEGLLRLLGAGTCHFTLHQPGSSNFTAAPISEQEFTIARADQTISLPDFSNPPYGPAEIRLDARASSGLPVTISATGPCEPYGSFLRFVGNGTCTLIASQRGNEDYNAAPPVTRTFEVYWTEPVPDPGLASGEP